MKGRGINKLKEFLNSSPSPLPCGVEKLAPQGKPSPIKGEGVLLNFFTPSGRERVGVGGLTPREFGVEKP